MLPSLVTPQLISGVQEFLRTAFVSSSTGFRRDDGRSAIDDFVDTPDALFKGPWLGLGLPFRTVDADAELPLKHFHPGFPPYQHQMLAFQRLCGDSPLSTLVATGTGSGKTECFMYPLLDRCLSSQSRGIKAIVIYPMNALATDQARRFAKEIHSRKALQDKVRVGLFVGDNDDSPYKEMTSDYVITCKETQRDNPPDILLTNYKMLDYLLIRPGDQPLWRYNEPGDLRYLVVDELHTFDGAQGTDLACLVRRLRHRLQVEDELACVGTSATIGGPESAAKLRDYASSIFSCAIDEGAVILEERLSADEFLEGYAVTQTRQPDETSLRHLSANKMHGIAEFVRSHARLWLDALPAGLDSSDEVVFQQACVELGEQLKQHEYFRSVLRVFESLQDLRLFVNNRAELSSVADEQARLASMLALVAVARSWRQPWADQPEQHGAAPFLQLRYQLWLRELRRMLASVEQQPVLRLGGDLKHDEGDLHLPAGHCRECGLTGWVSVRGQGDVQVSDNPDVIYNAFFNGGTDTRLLVPLTEDEHPDPANNKVLIQQLCGCCGALFGLGHQQYPVGDCGASGKHLIRVWVPDMAVEYVEKGARKTRFQNNCPGCEAESSILLMGSRAASLSSVMINRLYRSHFNDDHKLITFSDSVQDAAHRAGFFAARTWQNSFRDALQIALQERLQGMPLSMVAEQLSGFWLERWSKERFVTTFLPPNLEWLRDFETLKETGQLPEKSDLLEYFIKPRLSWEVFQELGMKSGIGRTLERTGRAVLAPDLLLLDRAASDLLPTIHEEIPELSGLGLASLRVFILGLLLRMKRRGAFDHPAVQAYRQDGGKRFLLGSGHLKYMPGLGRKAITPAFLTLEKVSSSFDAIDTQRWYRQWFDKTMASDGSALLASASFRQVYGLVLNALVRHGLMRRDEIRGQAVWSLLPQQWLCQTQVAVLSCDCCAHRIHVSLDQMADWQEVACLRASCSGHYRGKPQILSSGGMVLPKAPTRLVASEHTGLLKPDMRLQIENSFKTGGHPWDINLLSATPTMEMGIDIGDLSSVLLCSVPPAQANYLQRIGRAGRKDGNAVTVTVANGVPHDQYFYEQPLEMMAGVINTPGIFLGAGAVIERQLMAFCFDCWACSGVVGNAIPKTLSGLLDRALKGGDLASEGFPGELLRFIEDNGRELWAGFRKAFPEVEQDSLMLAHLQAFLFGENGQQTGIANKIATALVQLAQQRESFRQSSKQLKKSIDQWKSLPQDDLVEEQIDDAVAERQALADLIKSISGKQTLNFFTDEGLLPNYSFPEEGVKLQSVVFRRKEKAQTAQEKDSQKPKSDKTEKNDRSYEKRVFEVVRPSQAALSELAPSSQFYGHGRRVMIDQVDLNLSAPEEWRLCSACHYVEPIALGHNHDDCPRCASPMWRNASQRQTLLKLRQVFANTSDRDSRFGDDTEQREPAFFNRQLLVDIDPRDSRKAWRLADDQWPFGFEYLSKAVFREINFGLAMGEGAEFDVAGLSARRPGFKICKHCGKVHNARKDLRQNHSISCKLRKNSQEESPADFHNTLYLFRELTSEAIRILLPIAEVQGSEVRRQSLIAALQLGLKQYFGGDVSHLQMTEYSEPEPGTELRRHYLVILDTVPGGTGYLKQLLLSGDELMNMLQQALDHIEQCSCNSDPDKDGCYRCVYAYRDSRHLPNISRFEAQTLLRSVLDLRASLEPVDQLLPESLNPLHESELERLFIKVLGRQGKHVQISDRTVNGRPGHEITLQHDDRIAAWQIEPQVELGPADGVVLTTRPDFVFWPTDQRRKPIAVFLDGFAYHKESVDRDSAKRMALLESGQYWVWILGWDDIKHNADHENRNGHLHWLQKPRSKKGSQAYDRLQQALGWASFQKLDALADKGCLGWLLTFLAGDEQALAELAFARVLAATDVGEGVDPLALGYGRERWQGDHLMSKCQATLHYLNDSPQLLLVTSVDMSSRNADAMRQGVSASLYLDDNSPDDDRFMTAWRQYWAYFNLLQLLADFEATTALVQNNSVYLDLADRPRPGWFESAVRDESHDWSDALKLTLEPALLKTLGQALDFGIAAPVIGEGVQADSHEVLGEVEWSWPDGRIAWITEPENRALIEVLEARGWWICSASDPVAELTEQLKGVQGG